MLNYFNNLSLLWKFMLVPLLAISLIGISGIVVLNVISNDEKNLVNSQKELLLVTEELSQLATQLAENHTNVYELLRLADEDGDESRLYDEGKLLLNEIHDIERSTHELTRSIALAYELNSLLLDYRKQAVTAVEMSSVDVKLARQFMTDATSKFNKVNSLFLDIGKQILKDLNAQMNVHSNELDELGKHYTVVIVFIVLIVVFISVLLSRLLSRDLKKSIATLTGLSTSNEIATATATATATVNNELSQLTQVIEHVKDNHQSLEDTRIELSQQENQLRIILDNMLDAVISINGKGKILSVNNSAEKLFGYSEAEILGKNIKCLMPDEIAFKHDGYLQHYLKTGEKKIVDSTREVTGQKKNMQKFPMELSVTELPGDEGGERFFIGTCRDVSLIRQQEDQLRRSLKMDALGKLTGGIAHDYNNMLGVVMGYAESLQTELIEKPELAKYAREIYNAGERGAKLTKKLLGFSRQTGNNTNVVSINTLLHDEQHMLERILTARIQVVMELDNDLWTVKLDSSDLEDSIVNLCINAMHAIEGSGSIIIKTSNLEVANKDAQILSLEEGDYVQLSITDTGRGMDDEVKLKIFDPFFTTKGMEGTGLGLSQVYGFVERSGGAIQVDSEPGKGTCFSLYFPRCIESISNDSSEPLRAIDDLKGNETILVVDDELVLLRLTSKILTTQGYSVICARSAKEALDVLAQESIDLMISDIIMPEMDGYELAAVVLEKYPAVKIQLASGFTDDKDTDLIDKELQQNLLNKPYDIQSLLIRLRELLDDS